jgi:Uma2 family endonuclease
MREIVSDRTEVEYLDGRPYPKVSPKWSHGAAQMAIAMALARCGETRGHVVTEVRFKLEPGTEFVPDVAFVSFDRLRELGDRDAEEPPFAPDIAVEVRSPSARGTYEARKVRAYLAHGAVLVLDVDPQKRQVVAYARDGGARTYCEGESFEHEIVPWLRFEVGEVFANVRRPSTGSRPSTSSG